MDPALVTALLKLFGFTLLGYLICLHPFFRNKVLPVLLRVLIGFGFPVYSVSRINAGWEEAIAMGWVGMAGFFVAGILMIVLQFTLGRALVGRLRVLRSRYPKELVLLFAMHNCGYLPLPILAPLVPPGVLVYMFYYIIAFNIIFWTVSIPMLKNARRDGTNGGEDSGAAQGEAGESTLFGKLRGMLAQVRVTPPLVGVLVGIATAATGLYKLVPAAVQDGAVIVGDLAMDLILVALGGSLATAPFNVWRGLTELRWLAVLKMFAYPLLLLPVAWLLFESLRGVVGREFAAGIALVLVVQAASPPATNTMVVVRRWGNDEQAAVCGGGLIYSYFAAVLTLPGFILAGMLLFGTI